MINKEEIETEKNNGRRFIRVNRVEELFNRIKELEEINTEHQKINGELREENKKLREILEGKSIQEMGVSKLYGEEK